MSLSYHNSSELKESKPSVELRLFVFDEPYIWRRESSKRGQSGQNGLQRRMGSQIPQNQSWREYMYKEQCLKKKVLKGQFSQKWKFVINLFSFGPYKM